ncbi:hypothetical protein [Paenirhodobacter sp.]|uniref:hypothetical protein n=1 Tax=Paenirhodobacter sp. TaxID=1965326 RepID=UPI003B40DFA1
MSPRTDLQAKRAERDRIAHEIAGLRKRAADLQSRAANAEVRAEAERDAAAEADARMMADGGKPAARKAEPGADAMREAAAARRGAEMAEAEIPVLERALAGAESAIVDAALTVFRSERDAEHREVLAAVDALGFALARLLAADLAREALTGRRFVFDPARHPPADLWQPHPLVSALVAAMPARFTPHGWAEGIERGAFALAAKINGGSE